MIKSFVLGAITGGAIVWFWGQEIREFVDAQTQGMREAAADGLQAAKQTIESGLGGA